MCDDAYTSQIRVIFFAFYKRKRIASTKMTSYETIKYKGEHYFLECVLR